MHWLDVWLPRISHFSQFGLFVVTIGTLYFTVLPLYQKAVLEEAIARKEVQLADYEKSLDASYSRIRGYIVSEFAFNTGIECSGILFTPQLLQDLNENSFNSIEAEEIFDINVSACLEERLQKSENLKELRSSDLQTLASKVDHIIDNISAKRELALAEYKSIPQRAKSDPSILKPLGPFTKSMLDFLSKSQPTADIEANRYSLAVKETQSQIAHEYDAYIRDQVGTIRSIKWVASR